ncbi:hypothetical protein JOD62_002864 [Microbacterium keratanolyticum]|uniref:Restriction endonuclease type IV Mrr domain-containing protein n=1 Tax=Microbacterium keratanolyticum TaxID=67574 RepID=A0A9W6HU44_9MICO|nr:restriction endonuclease [Microbacterium keratanolyticum]MBM7470316.1 hypothetical protein [Microbacterium keratanolyticum]GLK02395.1 hypothetical protein GCM10017596_21100 [Microbacterium keratanolyticum]
MGAVAVAEKQFYAELRERAKSSAAAVMAGDTFDHHRRAEEDVASVGASLEVALRAIRKRRIYLSVFIGVAVAFLCFVLAIVLRDELPILIGFPVCGVLAFLFTSFGPTPFRALREGRRMYLAHLLGASNLYQREQGAQRREADAVAAAMREEALESLTRWQVSHPAPAAQPYGVSPAGAEAWVRDWMIHMGAEDATLTRYVGDGGVDVESGLYVAQVKHYTGTVAVQEVRAHIGVSVVDELGRRPVFFTSGGFTVGGVEAADRAGMPLFVYTVETGDVRAVNAVAAFLLTHGLRPSWHPAGV